MTEIIELFFKKNDLFFVPETHTKFLNVHGIFDKTFLLLDDVKIVLLENLDYNECYPMGVSIFCGGKLIACDSELLLKCQKCN
jgi:hypothetical protein